jgi:hypothetical protein
MNTKEKIDKFFELQDEVFSAFGYVEDWVSIPLDDGRGYYWKTDFFYDESGNVCGGYVNFAEFPEQLEDEEAGEYYQNEVYTQRFLPKWVYETENYTMICVDTHTDGNKFLQIFDNSKRIK